MRWLRILKPLSKISIGRRVFIGLLAVAILTFLSGCVANQSPGVEKQNPGVEPQNPGIETLAGIDWITSYDQGLKIMRQENKPMLLYFWASWCGWCRKMDTEVLPAPEVSSAIKENFITVKLDIDKKENSMFIAKYMVPGTPTYVIVTGQEEIRRWRVGYMDKEEFLDFLVGPSASVGRSGEAGMSRIS